ncbi:RNA-protein complex protein Nop10 [Halolamina sp. CBA1230]|uniref:RNA-protein complex protein Nop10 n=1 Tax=Halolamina sp. CBA1230 TaxID=1853690 RepID=UPI0009A1A9D2|nr:RNA-protein complex protein Nop10 [Halolamina sp. CBA1230]QKY21630.1 RNA-protein complex protein Nop10 [Halolamina sp. CBA1230]
MTKSDIRVCSAWRSEDDPDRADGSGQHDRPVYTLSAECPDCGAEAINSAPAPFDPADPYGEYRRRARDAGPDTA